MRMTFTITVEATDTKRADRVRKRWRRFVGLTSGIPGVAVTDHDEFDMADLCVGDRLGQRQ